MEQNLKVNENAVSYTHLDVYKRQVLFSATGTIGHPLFSAILKEPAWNGRRLNSSPLLRVPSGKIKTEIPFFT